VAFVLDPSFSISCIISCLNSSLITVYFHLDTVSALLADLFVCLLPNFLLNFLSDLYSVFLLIACMTSCLTSWLIFWLNSWLILCPTSYRKYVYILYICRHILPSAWPHTLLVAWYPAWVSPWLPLPTRNLPNFTPDCLTAFLSAPCLTFTLTPCVWLHDWEPDCALPNFLSALLPDFLFLTSVYLLHESMPFWILVWLLVRFPLHFQFSSFIRPSCLIIFWNSFLISCRQHVSFITVPVWAPSPWIFSLFPAWLPL
jgi:hypothetical protein